MSRLRTCARPGCGAAFLPRQRQKFCSGRCVRAARPPRSAHPRRGSDPHHRLILRLLDVQPLERRPRGGWRFGTKTIGDKLVDSLIASGSAEIRDGQLHRKVTP